MKRPYTKNHMLETDDRAHLPSRYRERDDSPEAAAKATVKRITELVRRRRREELEMTNNA